MRMSDVSSDVCSADLVERPTAIGEAGLDTNLIGRRLFRIEQKRPARQCREIGHTRFLTIADRGISKNIVGQLVGRIDQPGEGAVGPFAFDKERTAKSTDQRGAVGRSEEHTSELQSLMRISYAVF